MANINLNEDQLVMQSVIGEIHSPQLSNPYRVSYDGTLKVYPSTGGITYNKRIGDYVCKMKADHVEPAVTIKNSSETANGALNTFSCIGNEAFVVSGDAKGEKGFVTGKHGGCEHVLIDFSREVMEKMVIGDKIQIRAFGCGLEFTNNSDIKIFNIDPNLLKKINPKFNGENLEFPVTHIVPAKIMGSGLGRDNVNRGDYDIQLFDEKTKKEFNLESLRFGDFVAITDADHSYGRIYRSGAVSIGVVVHSDCIISGHGPGVCTILTSTSGKISPVIDETSNLKKYFYEV